MNETNFAHVHQVQTPFIDPDYGYDDEYLDGEFFNPANNVAQRMMIILIIVPIVAIALVYLAWPVSGNVTANEDNPIVEDNPIEVSVPIKDNTASDQQSEIDSVAAVVGQGAIAPFFTPEVKYWEPKIIEWANLHGVDPNAVATIMQIESCGDPQAVSIAGARGLFQVMPFHFSNGEDMLDPDTNATRGMNFFNEQLRYTGGDIFLSFAGYNGGYAASGGAYENWANETQRYYGWARGIYEDAQAGLDSSETLDTWLAAGGAAGCQRAASRLNIN